jgi:predicted nucleic-acid-binding Zn-ribbon protein
MDQNRQEQIIIALKEKGANQPCPRCRNLEFEVIGETRVSLTDRPGVFRGYAELPLILISCKQCGYIAPHATGVLGLSRQP